MSVQPQLCPQCGAGCKILVDLASANVAFLDDRVLGLGDLTCVVVCPQCGGQRPGIIADLDYSRENNVLEYGQIIYE